MDIKVKSKWKQMYEKINIKKQEQIEKTGWMQKKCDG